MGMRRGGGGGKTDCESLITSGTTEKATNRVIRVRSLPIFFVIKDSYIRQKTQHMTNVNIATVR